MSFEAMRRGALALGAVACGLLLQPGAALSQPAAAEQAGPFEAAAAKQAVEEFAATIEANYLYPKLGRKYAQRLRSRLAEGAYGSFDSDRQLTAAVESDLQAVQRDLHLHLIAPSVPTLGVVGTASFPSGTCPSAGRQIERSMGRAGWIAEGTAYIEFCAFRDEDKDLLDLAKFLDEHETARILIIDNRNNNGGGFLETDLVNSRLYASPVELLRLAIRRSVDEEDPFPFADGVHWTKIRPTSSMAVYSWRAAPDPARPALRETRVYVLTSRWTESAGEAFALALKSSRRATLVGERTQGAGHLAPTWGLPGGYRGQVPIGRVYDARTGKGWEGTGVKPDIEVAAENALATVLSRHGIDPVQAQSRLDALPSSQPVPDD